MRTLLKTGIAGLALAGLALAALPSTASASDTLPAPAIVHIRNFAFAPRRVAVAAGQTIEFINDDSEPHTVTAVDKTFDSAGLETHDSWRYQFDHAGTVAYYCRMHPYMTGTVVVRPVTAPQ